MLAMEFTQSRSSTTKIILFGVVRVYQVESKLWYDYYELAMYMCEEDGTRQAYLVNNEHTNEDDVIVEGEFPIISDPGCPPDDGGKEETHEHSW